MNRSPIARALSTLLDNGVEALVIGGQACIFYGGAEFSRDLDLAVLISASNLSRLGNALEALGAEPVYVPRLSEETLRAGHGCHFRCHADGLYKIRIDVLGVLRGTGTFEELWMRRNMVAIENDIMVPVISLMDLVRSKKTQRDKDWPMIRRLVEADMAQSGSHPPSDQVDFWLLECRTPELLTELATIHREKAENLSRHRPLLTAALQGDSARLVEFMRTEEYEERARDQEYWAPLKRQLRTWRKNPGV